MTKDRFAAESCTARTTAPPRLRRLGIASSPLKLWKIRRPHEPKPFGPALYHLYLLRGHAGDGTDCMSPRRIAHAASDREGAERLPSADRSQRNLNSAGLHRDSAARLCSALVNPTRDTGIGHQSRRRLLSCLRSLLAPLHSQKGDTRPRDASLAIL